MRPANGRRRYIITSSLMGAYTKSWKWSLILTGQHWNNVLRRHRVTGNSSQYRYLIIRYDLFQWGNTLTPGLRELSPTHCIGSVGIWWIVVPKRCCHELFWHVLFKLRHEWFDKMTSSNGNVFRVTGHLCGEFTGPGEFPTQRPVTRSFGVFFELRLNKRLNKQS